MILDILIRVGVPKPKENEYVRFAQAVILEFREIFPEVYSLRGTSAVTVTIHEEDENDKPKD